jgi:hypothetical protein
MIDKKDTEERIETLTFWEKLEKATPANVSMAIIAKIMLKISDTEKP